MKTFMVILLAISLHGNVIAAKPDMTGETNAGRRLFNDTFRMLSVLALRGDCDAIDSIQTAVLEHEGGVKGSWKERWITSACGASKSFLITFTPTPAIGGTDFSIIEEKLPKTAPQVETTPSTDVTQPAEPEVSKATIELLKIKPVGCLDICPDLVTRRLASDTIQMQR